MKTAKELKEIAFGCHVAYEKAKSIVNICETEANKGEFKLQINGELSGRVIMILISQGFVVGNIGNNKHIISWD